MIPGIESFFNKDGPMERNGKAISIPLAFSISKAT